MNAGLRNAKLDAFLHQGKLPFIGRMGAIEAVDAFLRSAIDAHELRIGLILGEAGAGKSRLVEEFRRTLADTASVVHIRFYPDTSTSIWPLVSQGIRLTGKGGSWHDLDDTPANVVAALRRLTRLFPTLLILEDIHLLTHESSRELTQLLDFLSGEVLSVLCLARPSDLQARSAIERWLVQELRLSPFSTNDVEHVLNELFPEGYDPRLPALLQSVTAGNPLALRSALRALLSSETLLPDERKVWMLTASPEAAGELLRGSVQYLVEGLTAGLDRDLNEAAQRLSVLGEIFAVETAGLLVENVETTIAELRREGVLQPAATSSLPLCGSQSEHRLLAFTHTLLHEHLLRNANPDGGRLISIVGSGLPIHATTPFTCMAMRNDFPDVRLETVEKAIECTIAVSDLLDRSPNWSAALPVLSTAERLFEHYRERWSLSKQRVLQAEILDHFLFRMTRSYRSPERITVVRQLDELTRGEEDPELLPYRLRSLHHSFGIASNDRSERHEVWGEAKELVKRHPSLAYTRPYLNLLRRAAEVATLREDWDLTTEVENAWDVIKDDPNLSEELRAHARHTLETRFLLIYRTPEELERRLRMLDELEEGADKDMSTGLEYFAIWLLWDAGYMERGLQEVRKALPKYTDRHLHINEFYARVLGAFMRSALGAPLREVTREIEIARNLSTITQDHRDDGAGTCVFIGFMLDDPKWTMAQCLALVGDLRNLTPEHQIELLILANRVGQGSWEEARRLVQEKDRDLIARISEARSREEVEAFADTVREEFGKPVFTFMGIYERLVMLLGLERLDDSTGWRETLGDAAVPFLSRVLDWMEERELFAWISPLAERHERLLGEAESARRRRRAQELRRLYTNRHLAKPVSAGRRRLSMLGTIEVQEQNGDRTPVRGARHKTLLGLLVANELLRSPLNAREFAQLTAGEEDPLRARKRLNSAVFRLRELLGQDVVMTDEPVPRLNLEALEIDLLNVREALREAKEALRRGRVGSAIAPLERALTISAGEVAFPGLYEDIFESLREELDTDLRETLLKAAALLLAEEAFHQAEGLLTAGNCALPEDEEIVELLCKALEGQGKRSEAVRMRNRIREDSRIP